jgi:hypothetical protein
MACVIQPSSAARRSRSPRLALRRLASPPPPQLHSSGSNLPHYSFGSSAPLVMSLALGADLFSSLLPGGAADVPPEPNIWD